MAHQTDTERDVCDATAELLALAASVNLLQLPPSPKIPSVWWKLLYHSLYIPINPLVPLLHYCFCSRTS
jgi:hypothetical protein